MGGSLEHGACVPRPWVRFATAAVRPTARVLTLKVRTRANILPLHVGFAVRADLPGAAQLVVLRRVMRPVGFFPAWTLYPPEHDPGVNNKGAAYAAAPYSLDNYVKATT